MELLYWFKYRHLIHYNEKTDTVTFDSELPERARRSYEMWSKQYNQNTIMTLSFRKGKKALIGNVRVQRVYKPKVLEIMGYVEALDNWAWWGGTAADRKETKAFAKWMSERTGDTFAADTP